MSLKYKNLFITDYLENGYLHGVLYLLMYTGIHK